MPIGLFLNAIICFFTTGFIFSAVSYIYQNNKNNLVDFAYAGFWFFAGFTWLFVGLSLIIFQLGFRQWDLFVNQYIIQTVIYAQIVIGIYYVAFRLFKKHRLAAKIFWLFFILAIITLVFTFQKGALQLYQSSYYNVEYKVNQTAWQLFQTMFAIAMMGLLYDTARNIYHWWKRKELFEIKYFLANLSALVYGVIGYFDQQGSNTAWSIIIFRMMIIFCAHTAYFAYSNRKL